MEKVINGEDPNPRPFKKKVCPWI